MLSPMEWNLVKTYTLTAYAKAVTTAVPRASVGRTSVFIPRVPPVIANPIMDRCGRQLRCCVKQISGGLFYLPSLHWTDDRSCELRGFRSGVIEDFGLVSCYASSLGKWFPMFRTNASHSSWPFHPRGWRRRVLSKRREPLTQRIIPHPRRQEIVIFFHKIRVLLPLLGRAVA
jgi:hypothetical protein